MSRAVTHTNTLAHTLAANLVCLVVSLYFLFCFFFLGLWVADAYEIIYLPSCRQAASHNIYFWGPNTVRKSLENSSKSCAKFKTTRQVNAFEWMFCEWVGEWVSGVVWCGVSGYEWTAECSGKCFPLSRFSGNDWQISKWILKEHVGIVFYTKPFNWKMLALLSCQFLN